MATLAPAYAPRRPTETALYGIVRDNLETFLSWARETYAKPLPRYVEQELRAYLRCGVFAHGFVHCRCDDCGHDILVAFSCKQRGACPSCTGRRMANTAAHLVDRVLPDVPVRQYVLSLAFELRALAAFKPEVLRAMARLFVESIFGLYRTHARRDGLMGGECGAVTFVQRFGGSLNLNVHMHVVVLDGVFVRDPDHGVVFHAAPPPTLVDLEAIVQRVRDRALVVLLRTRTSVPLRSPPAAFARTPSAALGRTRRLPGEVPEPRAREASRDDIDRAARTALGAPPPSPLSAHSLPRSARAALGVAPRDRSASAGKVGRSHRRGGSEPSLLIRDWHTRPTRGQADGCPRSDRWRR